QRGANRVVVRVSDTVPGVATSEVLHNRNKPIEVIQTFDRRGQHLRQLPVLSGHVLRKHSSDGRVEFEQASIEERHCILGNRREGRKALLHQSLLTRRDHHTPPVLSSTGY